jgi:hypothetical protein
LNALLAWIRQAYLVCPFTAGISVSCAGLLENSAFQPWLTALQGNRQSPP